MSFNLYLQRITYNAKNVQSKRALRSETIIQRNKWTKGLMSVTIQSLIRNIIPIANQVLKADRI